jgi:HAD superfamily hydrolase (TIGR01490 family)
MESINKKNRSKQRVAFFDIDNTLLKGNLQIIYAIFFLKKRQINVLPLIKLGFLFLLQKLKLLNSNFLEKEGLAIIKGFNEKEFKKLLAKYSDEIYEGHIKKRLNQKVLERMQELKDKKYKIVILSAVPDFFIETLAKKLKVNYILGSRIHVCAGKFTGKIDFFCYDINKLKSMQRFVNKHNIDLSQSYSFADSFTDKNELEFVGYPIVVNPDLKLRRYAKIKGWQILN